MTQLGLILTPPYHWGTTPSTKLKNAATFLTVDCDIENAQDQRGVQPSRRHCGVCVHPVPRARRDDFMALALGDER